MHRDFRLYLTGQTTSTFGSVLTGLAVPLIAVAELGATPAQTGMLVAAGSLPLLTVGLLVGAWADRIPRRRPYLIAGDLAAAAALIGMIALYASGLVTVWTLVVFAVVRAFLGLVVETVYFAHLTDLVGGGPRMVRARARLQAGGYTGKVLGRSLAGPLTAVHTVAPFLVDLCTFLVSALTLSLIRKPEEPTPAPEGRTRLTDGLRTIHADPFLRRVTTFFVTRQIAAGFGLAVLAPFLLTVLHVPVAWYGALFVLTGVTGLAGTMLADRLADRVSTQRLTVLGFVGAILASALLPLAAGPVPVAATVAALGIGLPFFFGAVANVGVNAFLSDGVAANLQGRVSVGLHLLVGAAHFVGALVGGQIAEYIGIRPSLWIATGGSLAALWLLRPLLRRSADEPIAPDPAPPTPAPEKIGAAS